MSGRGQGEYLRAIAAAELGRRERAALVGIVTWADYATGETRASVRAIAAVCGWSWRPISAALGVLERAGIVVVSGPRTGGRSRDGRALIPARRIDLRALQRCAERRDNPAPDDAAPCAPAQPTLRPAQTTNGLPIGPTTTKRARGVA